MSKKVLIIGGGGREHALAWKLAQSPKVKKIYIAPGNAGTAEIGENVNITATEIDALLDFSLKNKIDLTVVGQDDPLALGIVKKFQKKGLKIWGPSTQAAQIESSKVFAKELMQQKGIPTARFQTFSNYDHALLYLERVGAPIVIKASGLALGKGAVVCKTLTQAKLALKAAMVEKVFGEAGSQVVIEEFLQGREFSVHAFCDGKHFKLLPTAQDHKPVFDGNLGPNTGGMGTIAPVPWVTGELMAEVSSRIIQPVLEGLTKLKSPFVGLLYPGLMVGPSSFATQLRQGFVGREATEDDPLLNQKKWVKVIEFNARFGDPETQSLMRLLKTDLYDIIEASVEGKLDQIEIKWHSGFACCIVLASGGYPGKYEKGKKISGIDIASELDDIVIFHAGTALPPFAKASGDDPLSKNKRWVTNGGRVLGVTATADTLQSALDKAYAAVKLIHFEGMHYRKDIGFSSIG